MASRMLASVLFFLLLHQLASSLPLCINQEAPFAINGSLTFCSEYGGRGCCSKSDDSDIAARFQALNISDSSCAGYIKQVLCSRCDTYAGDLYQQGSVPVLCNSTAKNSSSPGYCSRLWDACKDVDIPGSPFIPTIVGTSPPGSGLSGKASSENETLVGQWQSKESFCQALGSPQDPNGAGFCFDGGKYEFLARVTAEAPPPGVCFDKVGEENYIGLVPHPDGSNRAFLPTQGGQIFLAVLPQEGSSDPIKIDKRNPFLDISNFVVSDREFGLMSVVFHPEFVRNGRFFVSFNCDKQKWPGCGGGRCACNEESGCDPATISANDGSVPCQYSSVISEFSAGNSTVSPSRALTANPKEVSRILTLGLPYTTHHGGLLLFGPKDKYLYFMIGDGGGTGDPFNFSQNKKSLLGKILRLDVDKSVAVQEMNNMGLWGQYSIPQDNPFVQSNDSRPEIWALGLRNPWRCSFDAAKPEYFYCGDVGQSTYEEVNLITKGGNYGWRLYDGFNLFQPTWTPGGNTSLSSLQTIFPISGYDREAVNAGQGAASITGGYVSRSVQDACLYGKYLFADLYGANVWAITELPEGSGNYSSTSLNFTCSQKSPFKCGLMKGSSLPDIGFVYAWGEDNIRDVYLLTTNGVYKVVNPSQCNLSCTKKLPASATAPALTPIPSPPSPPAPPPSSEARLSHYLAVPVRFLFALSLLLVL